MAEQARTLRASIRVVAVHVTCDRCLASVRIQIDPADPFNKGRVFAPVMAWADAHLAPHVEHVDTETTLT